MCCRRVFGSAAAVRAASLARDVPVTQIYRGVLPFVAADILRLGVVVAFPALTLYLVKLLE